MSLIVPQGKVVVDSPLADGLVTTLGRSADWRINSDWQMEAAEYIEPLGAVGPVAQLLPRDMGDWSVVDGYNTNVRTVSPDWARSADSRQYTDGRVYASETAASTLFYQGDTWSADRTFRFLLCMVRNPPPAGQGIIPQVVVSAPATWYDPDTGNNDPGRISLYLPMAGTSPAQDDRLTCPTLYFIRDADRPAGIFSMWDYGRVLSQGSPVSASMHGPTREVWVVEAEAHPTRGGGWILVRNLNAPDRWWTYYHQYLGITTGSTLTDAGLNPAFSGRWTTLVAGAVTTWNLVPLQYTAQEVRAEPGHPWSINVSEMQETVTWDAARTPVSGWSNATTQGTYGPRITAQSTGTQYARPLFWYCTEDRAPVISGATSDPDSTEDTKQLVGLEYTQTNTWRNAHGTLTGTVENDELWADWTENGKVNVSIGWTDDADADLRETQVAVGYIPMNGIRRESDGSRNGGRPEVRISLVDWWEARVENTDIINFRQAGGRSVTDWLHAVGNRLGLPDSMIDVDDEVAYRTIPFALLPSDPSLAPEDGQSWTSHIDEVCRVMGIRVGVDKNGDGKLFADAGPPEYQEGVSTISVELDWAALAAEDKIRRISNEGRANAYRNCAKVTIADGPLTHQGLYYVTSAADRQTGLGTDAWKHLRVDTYGAAVYALHDFYEQFRKHDAIIEFTLPLRPDLRPDMFVRVSDVPYLDLTDEAVYQIVEHTIRAAGRDRVNSTSTFRAVRVEDESEPLTETGSGGYWETETDNDPPLNLTATGGYLE